MTPIQSPRVILHWNDESAAASREMAAAWNPSPSKKTLKNKSFSVEKLLKQFPDSSAKLKELNSILEARSRGTKNDTSTAFFKALN